MKVVAVHEDVLVVTSAIWATNAALVRGGEDEAFLVDSGVLPHEVDGIAALADRAGFRVVGLLVTHADWDHVLGPLSFPDAPMAVGETTAARLRAEPGRAQRELREFDERYYIARERPLSLSGVQALPVPGRLEVGAREIECHPADGHTDDGTAFVLPWARVLLAGDYLSAVEIPMLWSGMSLGGYLATLDRLEGLLEGVDVVVPGHGPVLDRERALAILREDRAYLEALRDRGEDAPLPLARRTGEMRKVHATNAERLAAARARGAGA